MNPKPKDFLVCEPSEGTCGVFIAETAKDAALEACISWGIDQTEKQLLVIGVDQTTKFDLAVVPQLAA
jgi:hypothetical protein